MAELIASGTAQADSSDITVTNQSVTLHLKTTAGEIPNGATAQVLMKESGGNYNYVGEITQAKPLFTYEGSGVFKVRRLAHTIAFGVDRD